MKLDVINLAKEAGDARLDPLGLGGMDVKWLERFAALVIDECTKEADYYAEHYTIARIIASDIQKLKELA